MKQRDLIQILRKKIIKNEYIQSLEWGNIDELTATKCLSLPTTIISDTHFININNFTVDYIIKGTIGSTREGYQLNNVYKIKRNNNQEQANFLEVSFKREDDSKKNYRHDPPIFSLKSINDLEKVNYVLFSSISTNCEAPYIKQYMKEDVSICEVFFPIIYHNQETADKMELLRDIIFAFFYYNNIMIVIQKACLIVKVRDIPEKNATLNVLLSPFLRFPGLARSRDKSTNLYCYSTKLTKDEQKFITSKFDSNFTTGVKPELIFLNDIKTFHTKKDDSSSQPATKSSFPYVLIFDSKIRQMKALVYSNFPILDIVYRRLKVGCIIQLILGHFLPIEGKSAESINYNVNHIISIVDLGQRKTIMDFANRVSQSFFYDGQPGSALCSCRNISNNSHVLYLTFRTADPDNILLNANAIAAALRISETVIFPVTPPLYFFIQCFEYAISHLDYFESNFYTKTIFLQFKHTTPTQHAKYFTKLFGRTLKEFGFSINLNYFIGADIEEVIISSKKTKKTGQKGQKGGGKSVGSSKSDIDSSNNDGKAKVSGRGRGRSRGGRSGANKQSNSEDDDDESQQPAESNEDDQTPVNKRQGRRRGRGSRSSRGGANKQNNSEDDDDESQQLAESNEDDQNLANRRQGRRRGGGRGSRGDAKKQNNSEDDDDDDKEKGSDDDNNGDGDNESQQPAESNEGDQNPVKEKYEINVEKKQLFINTDEVNIRNVNELINTLTLFSVVNDYREYIDMNLTFTSIGKNEKYDTVYYKRNKPKSVE